MNRKIASVAITALLLQAAFAFAHDSGEPSTASVLEKARQKYANGSTQGSGEEESGEYAESDGAMEEEEDAVPFLPLVISLWPGFSFPEGRYDAGIDLGLITASARDIKGFQGAGIFAFARNVWGFQSAGVFSIARTVNGFQGSGVFNIAETDTGGFQGAGVFNIADGRMDGFQGGGVFNIANGPVSGGQGAGVFNIAEGRLDGAQLAGVFNITEGEVHGVQAAGIFNSAGDMYGIQMGLVNVAEEADGIQLGLVNISNNGVNGIGAYFESQTNDLGLCWKNGGRLLHTVIRVQAPREDWLETANRSVVSFGLGSRIGGHRRNPYIDIELAGSQEVGQLIESMIHYSDSGVWVEPSNEQCSWPSLRISLGIPIFGDLHLLGGFAVDLDLAEWPMLPSRFKTAGYSWDSELFGHAYSAYGRWFIGFKI